MISSLVENIFEFLFNWIVEILLFYTGEIVLYVLTLGGRKPRWDYYIDENPSRFVILTELSVWVGFLFWILIMGLVVRIFLK